MTLVRQIIGLISLYIILSSAVFAQSINSAFESPLVDAANKNDKNTVLSLLKSGVPVNTKGAFGTTALMRAAYNGDIEICKILIENKADVNARDIGGATALHIATRQNKGDVVEFLLKHGANPEVKDTEGYTSATRAVKGKNRKIADMIANINRQHKVESIAQVAPLAPMKNEKPHEPEVITNLEPPAIVVQETLQPLTTEVVTRNVEVIEQPAEQTKPVVTRQSTVLDLRIYAKKKTVMEEPEDEFEDPDDNIQEVSNEPESSPIRGVNHAKDKGIFIIEAVKEEASYSSSHAIYDLISPEQAITEEDDDAINEQGTLTTFPDNPTTDTLPKGISVAEAVKLPDDIDLRKEAHLIKRPHTLNSTLATEKTSKAHKTQIEVIGFKSRKNAIRFWKSMTHHKYFKGAESKVITSHSPKMVKLMIGKLANPNDTLKACEIVKKHKAGLACKPVYLNQR